MVAYFTFIYAAFFSEHEHCGIGKALPFLGKRTFPSITTERLKIISHGSPHLGQIPVAIVDPQLTLPPVNPYRLQFAGRTAKLIRVESLSSGWIISILSGLC